jgi:hypothetical protein
VRNANRSEWPERVDLDEANEMRVLLWFVMMKMQMQQWRLFVVVAHSMYWSS